MTTPTPTPVAGIDVGKSSLDVHILHGDLDRQFNNDKCGHCAVRNWLLKHGVTRAVLEPTGRYHRNLRLLSDLLACRRKLAQQLAALCKLRAELAPDAAACSDPVLDAMLSARADCDARMQACIAADAALSRRAAIIRSIPGFGPVNAACLCADMPELGDLPRRQAAALFGVAPFDRDPGHSCAGRRIRGGRVHPRNLLYMAATSAIRCKPVSKAYYRRLRALGKKHEVAMVAIMRKLVSLLTALLRDNRLWQPATTARQPVA